MFILSDALAPWGQTAAIILAIYMFINILLGLAFAAALMFGFAWIRQKVELIKKLRSTVDSVNRAIEAPEIAIPREEPEQKLVQVVHKVQSLEIPQKIEGVDHQVHAIEQKIDQGADRVAEAVIEFRARTVMVKTIVKAFFLPGLTKPKRQLSLMEVHGFDRAVNRDGAGPLYSPEASSRAVVARTTRSDQVEDAQIRERESAGARRADNAPPR
jgi:hypothetical protein